MSNKITNKYFMFLLISWLYNDIIITCIEKELIKINKKNGDAQIENIQLKVSQKFKFKIEDAAREYGLKVGPYIKMLIAKDIKENEVK